MLIKLSDGCWVAAGEVTEVKVNPEARRLTVRTKDGVGHSLGAEYGESIYTTADRLISQINAAVSQPLQQQ